MKKINKGITTKISLLLASLVMSFTWMFDTLKVSAIPFNQDEVVDKIGLNGNHILSEENKIEIANAENTVLELPYQDDLVLLSSGDLYFERIALVINDPKEIRFTFGPIDNCNLYPDFEYVSYAVEAHDNSLSFWDYLFNQEGLDYKNPNDQIKFCITIDEEQVFTFDNDWINFPRFCQLFRQCALVVDTDYNGSPVVYFIPKRYSAVTLDVHFCCCEDYSIFALKVPFSTAFNIEPFELTAEESVSSNYSQFFNADIVACRKSYKIYEDEPSNFYSYKDLNYQVKEITVTIDPYVTVYGNVSFFMYEDAAALYESNKEPTFSFSLLEDEHFTLKTDSYYSEEDLTAVQFFNNCDEPFNGVFLYKHDDLLLENNNNIYKFTSLYTAHEYGLEFTEIDDSIPFGIKDIVITDKLQLRFYIGNPTEGSTDSYPYQGAIIVNGKRCDTAGNIGTCSYVCVDMTNLEKFYEFSASLYLILDSSTLVFSNSKQFNLYEHLSGSSSDLNRSIATLCKAKKEFVEKKNVASDLFTTEEINEIKNDLINDKRKYFVENTVSSKKFTHINMSIGNVVNFTVAITTSTAKQKVCVYEYVNEGTISDPSLVEKKSDQSTSGNDKYAYYTTQSIYYADFDKIRVLKIKDGTNFISTLEFNGFEYIHLGLNKEQIDDYTTNVLCALYNFANECIKARDAK